MLKVKLEGHSCNKFQTFIRSKFEYMKRIKNRLMRQKGPVIATAFQRPAKSFSEKHPGQLESIKREMDLVKKFYILISSDGEIDEKEFERAKSIFQNEHQISKDAIDWNFYETLIKEFNESNVLEDAAMAMDTSEFQLRI
jgi:hypothetical protein